MHPRVSLKTQNAQPVAVRDIPLLPFDAFRQALLQEIAGGGRLAAWFGRGRHGAQVRLLAVIARDPQGELHLLETEATGSFPSLTPECPQAQGFEREIAEQWGVVPEGHPWLKPLRSAGGAAAFESGPLAKATGPAKADGWFRVEGDEIHEVAVGPVHAGVIEPGHFRFQCLGEAVLHLEIALGYQHRGAAARLSGGPDARTIHYMETLAGDTTIGHALAYCQAVEALAGRKVPGRALAWRAIGLELERLANHVGDLGALANDVGYLPTAAFCGRLRGDYLNLTARICGSRFGRSWVRPGGVRFDLAADQIAAFSRTFAKVLQDTGDAVRLLWKTPSVMARFEGAGVLSRIQARGLGLVGPAARASGCEQDVRFDFPTGLYRFAHIPISTWNTGDVFARAYVRWLEIQRSAAFIQEQLRTLPAGPVESEVGTLRPGQAVVSLIEGWRGEICHAAVTDEHGRFEHYQVQDPSFHNWLGLAQAMRDQTISDFPLCNKSFNLSYCGHDL